VGALVLVIFLLYMFNQWPILETQYTTSMPLPIWRLSLVAGLFVLSLLAGSLCWLLVGLAASLFPAAWQLFNSTPRRLWRRDAMICTVLALAAGAGLNKLGELFASRFHAFAPVATAVSPEMFNGVLPGAGFFLVGLAWSIVTLSGLAVVIYVIRLGWTKHAYWLWPGILLLLVALGPADAHSAREFFAGWAMNFVPLAVGAPIVFFFFRENILAYFGAAFCLNVGQTLVSLLSQQTAFSRYNGLLLAVLSLLFLAWLFMAGGEGRVRSEP